MPPCWPTTELWAWFVARKRRDVRHPRFREPSGGVTITRGQVGDTLAVNAVPDLTAALTLGSTAAPFGRCDDQRRLLGRRGNNLAIVAGRLHRNGRPLRSPSAFRRPVAYGRRDCDRFGYDPCGSVDHDRSADRGPSDSTGAADAVGVLGLTDAELDRVTTASLQVGSGTSGAISIAADITRPTSTNVRLTGGGDLTFAGGKSTRPVVRCTSTLRRR